MIRTLITAAVLFLPQLARGAEKYVSMVTGDLTLERAANIALKQNPDLLRALKEIERTRGQVIEVRAQALPHVVLDANYRQQDKDLLERTGRSSGFGGGDFQFGTETVSLGDAFGGSQNRSGGDKTWRATIEVRQLVYSGGRLPAANKIAKFTEDQSYFLLRDTVDRVVAQVRSQFYAVLLDRKLITVAEESIRLLEDELKDQRNRFDAGTVPRFNVLRAEVAVANAQPDLIRARNAYLIAELELAKTLGLDAAKNASGKPAFTVIGELRARQRTYNIANGSPPMLG